MPVLRAEDSVLLVIDLQEKLVPALAGGDAAVSVAARLLEGAQRLGVPVRATEQTPDKLGPTVGAIASLLDAPAVAKTTFAATEADELADELPAGTLVIVGAEAHVCVLQTALAQRAAGHAVAVVADAVASRTEENRRAALDRARAHGADVVTAEMVLFEWLASSEHEAFRAVQKLIK